MLFKASFDHGALTSDRVSGVLEYVEKHHPNRATAVLKAYARLVAAEEARGHAIVEHAGEMPANALQSLADTLGRRYGRKVSATARPNPDLIAGVRVRIGDDIFESSVAAQLADLAASV